MINVSEQYRQQICADHRQFMLKAEFCRQGADGEMIVVETLTGADSLVSMTVEEAAAAEDRISMGNFCCAKLTMELVHAPSSLEYEQLMVRAYSGLLVGTSYEYVLLGTFYITEAETRNNYKNLTLTAYDGACMLEDECTISQGFPMSVEELTAQIAAEKGLQLHPACDFKEYLLPAPLAGYTYRQTLGFLAGLMGCNVRFDRQNRLQFYWYDAESAEISVGKEQQYLNKFVPKTLQPLTVTSISCTDGERSYYRGQGTAGVDLVMENPYMTEPVMEDIWQARIADMNGAETIAQLPVTYDGEMQEENLFTAVYNQSLETLQAADLSFIYPGTVMVMTYHLEETEYREKILVTETDPEAGRFAFARGETEDETEANYLPDGLSVSLYVEGQWRFTDEAAQLIQEGDLLKSSEGSMVIVSMIDHAKGELYLTDTGGSPVFGMEPGTQLTLTKVQISEYLQHYLPAELKWRGNPAVEAGDVILAEQEDGTFAMLYVMKQTLKLGGGLYSEIVCEGENETSSGFSSLGNGPVDRKLDRVYTSLQETILKATERITGQTGGHVVIHENQKGPSEILIMDTADIRTAKKVWRWNQSGLGYSSNGYEGPYGTAITQDGEIVGSFLQANSIAGSKLNIDSKTIERIIAGINAGEEKIHSAVLEIDSEDLSNAIRMEVSEIGGFNKISNSAGLFGTDKGWDCTGDISVETGTEAKQYLVSGSAFVIPAGGSIKTKKEEVSILLNTGKFYTLSAAVQHNDARGTMTLFMGEQPLASVEIGGSGGNWEKYEARFQVPAHGGAEPFSLEILSETGALHIGDLLLTEGSSTTWSPYPGEVNSAALSMSQFGISIDQNNAKTKTIIDAEGTRVLSTEIGEETVAEYTKDGVEAKNIIAREQVAAGRMRMIAMNDKQMVAWVINNDTEVDL